jgi:hypothetical protein
MSQGPTIMRVIFWIGAPFRVVIFCVGFVVLATMGLLRTNEDWDDLISILLGRREGCAMTAPSSKRERERKPRFNQRGKCDYCHKRRLLNKRSQFCRECWENWNQVVDEHFDGDPFAPLKYAAERVR